MLEGSVQRRHDRRQFASAALGSLVIAIGAAATVPLASASERLTTLEARRTALILVDFQASNAALTLKPYPFDRVVENAAKVASHLRTSGGLVVHTRVLLTDMLDLPADKPLAVEPSPADGDDLVAALRAEAGDVVVTKRQWGAFYGTDLEQQLRRHDIRWLMISGVATEVGVESTAREAFDRGYPLVFVEDAIAGATNGTHDMFLDKLFPRMGLVRSTSDAIGMLRP